MDEKDSTLTPCCKKEWIINIDDEATPYTHAYYSYSCSACKMKLINQEELKMTDEKELKLEVGKKYIHSTSVYNPFIYIGNKEIFGIVGIGYPFLFLDKDGDTHHFDHDNLKNIKEYQEPKKIIERSCEAWVNYSPGKKPDEYIIDQLTGLYVTRLYQSEEEAKLHINHPYTKCKKIYITVKFEE